MNRADITRLLTLVQQYDQREITADTISDWHHTLAALDYPTAEEAVHIHHKTSGFAIHPTAILDITKQIQTRTTTTPNRKRRARMGTYTITGAINYDCDRCKAPAGQPCTRDGNETAAPCITRLLGRPINEPAHNHRQRA